MPRRKRDSTSAAAAEVSPTAVEVMNDSELRRRRRAAQRAILEMVPVSSPAFERHSRRLESATSLPRRVAAYEATVRECGLQSRYAELRRK